MESPPQRTDDPERVARLYRLLYASPQLRIGTAVGMPIREPDLAEAAIAQVPGLAGADELLELARAAGAVLLLRVADSAQIRLDPPGWPGRVDSHPGTARWQEQLAHCRGTGRCGPAEMTVSDSGMVRLRVPLPAPVSTLSEVGEAIELLGQACADRLRPGAHGLERLEIGALDPIALSGSVERIMALPLAARRRLADGLARAHNALVILGRLDEDDLYLGPELVSSFEPGIEQTLAACGGRPGDGGRRWLALVRPSAALVPRRRSDLAASLSRGARWSA